MAKHADKIGNINTFIDRMLAKREQSGGEVHVTPPAGVSAASFQQARKQLAAMPARERNQTSLIGLAKQIEARKAGGPATQRAVPLRVDIEKILAKRVGTPAEKAIAKALGITTKTGGDGAAGPWGRGTGQGLGGKGFGYEFPEEPEKGTPKAKGPKTPPVEPQASPPGGLGKLNLVGRLARLTGDIRTDQAKQDQGRKPGGSAATASGIVIAEEFRAPHTLRDKRGRNCRTDRWFDRCGLCYDASLPEDARGGANQPMLWVGGTSFKCYYPQSSRADFASMMSSGSTGRWLNSFALKSQYVSF